jgi:tetratricopeptide (TPR) repeat protein
MRATRVKTKRRRSGPTRDLVGAARFLEIAAGHAAAGRLAEAAAAYERAEAADPDDFRAPISLATIDLQLRRPAQALPRLRRAAALKPDLFDAQHNLGAVAQSLEQWDEAAAAYERALALRAEAAETRRNLAIVLTILGRVDEAAALHRQLLDEPAMSAWALTRLALLRPAAVTDAELERLRRLAGRPDTNAETRIGLLFAEGEVLERRGDDAAAFAAFTAGNRLKRESLQAAGVDIAGLIGAHAEAARRVTAHFTAELLSRRHGEGLSTAAPIFIVGMPRSGSTLLEQILSSHPQVAALGEAAALPPLLERGFPEGSAETRTLARRYLEAVRAADVVKTRWRSAGRFVDKTLENYLHVGAIALMFPRAVILHAVRGPVDTCLSCYRQLFARGSETLYDQADIGAEYVTYRRVMEHWRAALGGRVIDVDHEALVADPEGQIRWLVTEACGLPWHDACLRFHEAAGAVRTASSSQVRQPIFTTSVARWRRYEAELGPLLTALGHYAPYPHP